MSGLLDSVDLRTQLAGRNRMELLLFRLGRRQLFGINVFKVKEVIQCPPLTKLPQAHPVVCGISRLREKTVAIMDLAKAMGKPAIQAPETKQVIITEYNRSTQGFLVNAVDRIINTNWDHVVPPPKGSGQISYLTAVTRVDDVLVEIIDVEKIMSEVMGTVTEVSAMVLQTVGEKKPSKHILVADDSTVARNQVKRTLEQLGYDCTLAKNGREALTILQQMAKNGPISEQLSLVISDVEMPEMDGYTLSAEIRKDASLKDTYIILHTSLSGVFNNALIQAVGANRFIPKFNPDELANAVLEALDQVATQNG